MRNYKNIKAFQLSDNLVLEIYKATKGFSKEEIYGLMSQLRRATGHIKIIALTSFAMKGDRDLVMKAGFDDYISKPINTRNIPQIIETHLEKRETSYD